MITSTPPTSRWDGYRDGAKMTLDQAMEIAAAPSIFQPGAVMAACYVLGEYVRDYVIKQRELLNGL